MVTRARLVRSSSEGRKKMIRWMDREDISQQELADMLSEDTGHGLSQAAISQWSRGIARPDYIFRHYIAVRSGGLIQPRDWETKEEHHYSQPVPVVVKS